MKPITERIYHCTFRPCSSDFIRKGDWKRHEQATHMPQDDWICLLSTPLRPSESGDLLCTFCDDPYPSEEHWEEAHRLSACSSKDEADRTFSRKDKLAQHLLQVHGVSQMTEFVSATWVRPVNRQEIFVCGFCSIALHDWGERSDHVANHFEEGMPILLWQDAKAVQQLEPLTVWSFE